MDGGRSSGRSPKGPGPSCVPRRNWTQDKESDRKSWGPAGTQPSFPLCPLSAPCQFRDPAQAAHEQPEAQRPAGWEAPQVLQPAQQTAETHSTGCECSQEATHQDAGSPLPARSAAHHSCCHLCPARAPDPPACRHGSCYPLPSSCPGSSSVSHSCGSCPPCCRTHPFCSLLVDGHILSLQAGYLSPHPKETAFCSFRVPTQPG